MASATFEQDVKSESATLPGFILTMQCRDAVSGKSLVYWLSTNEGPAKKETADRLLAGELDKSPHFGEGCYESLTITQRAFSCVPGLRGLQIRGLKGGQKSTREHGKWIEY